MGQLVFQATLGGQVNLVGPNTASTYNINVPAVAGNMVTTGDTGTVTNTMCATSVYTAPGTIGSGTPNTGAFTTLSGSTSVTTPIVKSASSLTLQTNGTTTAVTIDTSQNVGIGATPSAWYNTGNLQVGSYAAFYTNSSLGSTELTSNTYRSASSTWNYIAANYASRYQQYDGTHRWSTAASGSVGGAVTWSESMRIDSSGNVGIGTSSPAPGGLTIYKASTPYVKVQDGTNYVNIGVDTASGGYAFYNSYSGHKFLVNTGVTEAMRIDSSGNLLVGTTSSSIAASPGIKLGQSATAATIGIVTDTAANTGSYHLYNVNATNNGYRFYVNTNGGIANFSANNVNLSDERTKTNIQDAGGYLAKICSIPVRTFKYKDQTDDLLNLGVIAQEVEAVAPELVDVSGFGETPEDGVPLKAIYQTDLQYALMKCIQEQQALITQLQADVAELKG
jgi:hypothetical protein